MSTNKCVWPSVGYKNPPVATRFQKGKSGNPNGRPRGSKSWDSVFDTEMDSQLRMKDGTYITAQKAVIKRLVTDAINGKPYAQKMCFEHMQKTEQVTLWEVFGDRLIQDGYIDIQNAEAYALKHQDLRLNRKLLTKDVANEVLAYDAVTVLHCMAHFNALHMVVMYAQNIMHAVSGEYAWWYTVGETWGHSGLSVGQKSAQKNEMLSARGIECPNKQMVRMAVYMYIDVANIYHSYVRLYRDHFQNRRNFADAARADKSDIQQAISDLYTLHAPYAKKKASQIDVYQSQFQRFLKEYGPMVNPVLPHAAAIAEVVDWYERYQALM